MCLTLRREGGNYHIWAYFSSVYPTYKTMIGENLELVTKEPVEFEKLPAEVQDCRKITDHFRGIHSIYPNLIKENRRMSATCNRLDLQTLGSQLIMPNNLPDRWYKLDLLQVCWRFVLIDLEETNSKSLKLIMVSSQLLKLTCRLHTTSRLSGWMNERYVRMW